MPLRRPHTLALAQGLGYGKSNKLEAVRRLGSASSCYKAALPALGDNW